MHGEVSPSEAVRANKQQRLVGILLLTVYAVRGLLKRK